MKLIDGHFSFGPITIYGMNAMAFATNIRTRLGTLCIRPTTYFRGRWWRWYIYLSPDGTPQRSTFAIGPGIDILTKMTATIRRYCFGHNFDTSEEMCDWNRAMINHYEAIHMENIVYK